MEKQSIESMYKLMDSMRDKMGDLLKDAQELLNAAKTYGGEISRVMTEQLTQYFGPSIQKLINDDQTPGSVIGLIKFMDSIPLSFTRMETESDIVDPVNPESPENLDINEPATLNNDLDNIPRNASFAHPEGEESQEPATLNNDLDMMESVENKEEPLKEYTKYQVVRDTNVGSSLGDYIANLEPVVVAEFDTEEEANERVASLNATVLPSEKEAMGTEYKVVPFDTVEAEDKAEEKKETK